MGENIRLGIIGLGLALPALPGAVSAQTVNFHEADNGYGFYGAYGVLYYGQGAAPDKGNNVWNGFKASTDDTGPGSTALLRELQPKFGW